LNILEKISNFINRVNDIVGNLTSWLTTVLVVIVCFDVFTRYVMQNSSVAVQELQWHIFAVIFLMGAGYTLKEDKHVRVDVFYTTLSEKKKAYINLFGTVLFLLPFSVLVIKTSLPFAVNAFHFHEGSPNPGGLPHRWILKSFISAGFFFLMLQGISTVCRSLLIIADKGGENG